MQLEKIGFYTLSDERIKNTSITSQMKRGEMIITEYCNYKCSYCRKECTQAAFSDRKSKQMTLDEIKKGIDYWCENKPIENIRFSGGEPTLHKDIMAAVSYAKSKKIKRIAISTNGSNKFSMYRELISLGVNDFSISLDADCSSVGDMMAGGIEGSFDIAVANIKELSKLTYVTVGVVLLPDNIDCTLDTIKFADKLGVADIRIISAAQWNQPIEALGKIDQDILNRHPILKYRAHNFQYGINVRGMTHDDSPICGLVIDDSVIVGANHYSCVIAFRENAPAIGKVGPTMRQDRIDWMKSHNCFEDKICSANCLDVCTAVNRKFREYHLEYKLQTNKKHLPVIQ
jgi:molybdenum cofactor biosynthesis enzyme MoaA